MGQLVEKMMLKYGVSPERIYNQFLTVDVNSFIEKKTVQRKVF